MRRKRLLKEVEGALGLSNDFSVMYHRFALPILRVCRGTATSCCSVTCFCFLTHSNIHFPVPKTFFSASPLSLLLKEFSIHLIPLLVLYIESGPCLYSMSKDFSVIEHQILASQLALASPCSAPCIFRNLGPGSLRKSSIVGISVNI